MSGVKIGTLALETGLMLAPMAGVTDAAFRGICRTTGAEYTVSEMISAKALCFEQRGKKGAPTKTAALAAITSSDAPMALQLFGSDPQYMGEAAALLTSGCYRGAVPGPTPAAIDINMGCPVHKVVSNGEGSALMKTPALAAAIVTAVKKATHLPVTVKIRAGWDAESINAVELSRALEAAGADLICVHGRTRQQFYAPSSDNGIIAAVKRAVKIPVIGNGDIFSAADALRMYEETGCDGVMIARGALGNPFIFEEIKAALEGREYAYPTAATRLQMALNHAKALVTLKGERIGIAEARKHMAWYSKGLRGSAAARDSLMHAVTIADIAAVFDLLLREEAL